MTTMDMRHANPAAGSRSGFTLLEILVALVLIGLLVGTLVPAVLNQLGRGEVNRVVEDLASVETAAKTFRVDVNRWPADLPDLITRPSSTDNDVNAKPYGGLVNQWSGPYFERGALDAGNTISTSLGGSVQSAFSVMDWGTTNTSDYFVIQVGGLTAEDIEAISTAVDGDATVTQTSDAAGRVRSDGNATSPTLLYFVAPIR